MKSSWPALRVLSVSVVLLSVLLLLSGLLFPALPSVLLPLGRVLSLLGVAFIAAALIQPSATKRWVTLGLAFAYAGLLLEPALRALVRPLSFAISEVVAALFMLLLASAFWLARRPDRTAKWVALSAVAVTAGIATASGFAAGTDFLGVSLWSAFSAGIGGVLALILLVLFTGSRPSRPVALGVLAAGLVTSVLAFTREFAWLSVDSLLTPERQATLTAPLIPVAIVMVVGLALMVLPSKWSRAGAVRVAAAVPLAGIFLGTSLGSSAALAEPLSGDLAQITVATPSDVALSQRMLGVAGAGPRDEFRGKSFYDCDEINSRDCFITFYDDMAIREGVAVAVADVVAKTKENKGVTFPAHCHQVVHNLGQLAFEIAEDFTDAADIDPQVCGTGYTHGLWEQQFVVLGDEVIFQNTATLCEELNMVTPWYNWTCSHIMGHILVTRMMGNPGQAVEYCNRIIDTQAITDCQAGGWMNFFQDDIVIAKMDTEGSLKDLFSVCYGASTEVKFFCYQELFPVIYPLVGGNDYLAAQACLEYAEPGQVEAGSGPGRDPWDWDVSYADRCIQGLARGVLVSSFDDYRRAGPRCLSMPEGAHDPCLTSTAASIVLNTGSTAAAFQLCRLVKNDAYRTYCYFWAKHSRKLLANGPNNQNLPSKDEIRLPEDGRVPGAPVTDPFEVLEPDPSRSGSAPAGS